MSTANGTPNATLQYRRFMLEAHGLDPKLAESLTGRLRTEIAVEVRELARKHSATPPAPTEPPEPDTDDPAELRQRYGRRRY